MCGEAGEGMSADSLQVTSGGITMRVLFKTMAAQEFMKRVHAAVLPQIAEIADAVAKGAEARAPRHEGQDTNDIVLAESITAKLSKKGVGFKVRTNTRQRGKKGRTGYGADLEFGDSRIAAQPFLYPAYDAEMQRLKSYLENVL